MVYGEVALGTPLPAYDRLHSSETYPHKRLTPDTIDSFLQFANKNPGRAAYRWHLSNTAFRNYIQSPVDLMDPTAVTIDLDKLGNQLKKEELPDFLIASGHAFAESALIDSGAELNARVGKIYKAQSVWTKALGAYETLRHTELGRYLYHGSQPYRIALNLAQIPILRAVVEGSLDSESSTEVQRTVFADSLAVVQHANLQQRFAESMERKGAKNDLDGFILEGNALLVIRLLDDSEHVTLPSTARAGSGMSNGRMTHDIATYKLHDGEVYRQLPYELKSSPRSGDMRRYNALLLSKADLTTEDYPDNRSVTDLIATVFEGRANEAELASIDEIRAKVWSKIQDYQTKRKLRVFDDAAA